MNIKIIKPTPFGPVAILWSQVDGSPKICRILISKPELSAEDQAFSIYPHLQVSSSKKIEALAMDIKRFLEGEDVSFSLDDLMWEQCTPFQKSVLLAEHHIPRGSVSTYQLIARQVGVEKGARAVGNALANNPFPIIVPCHRAIRSDGTIGGFQGGLDMKKALLEKEGISFHHKGRVMVPKFHYGK